MGLKTFIRTVVVRTNPYPPFSRLNRLPYSLAIVRVKRLAARFDGIVSIYLRHGLTRDDWEPGLSDIDLTIVLDGSLSADGEFDLVSAFLAAYRALARWFPMLGEVEILGERCCSAWSRFSIRGYEVSQWRLIAGRSTVRSAYSHDAFRIRKDRLDHACFLYETQVVRRFYRQEITGWIGQRILQRVARKTLRYADPSQRSQDFPNGAAALLAAVLEMLDSQVKNEKVGGSSVRAGEFHDENSRPLIESERYAELENLGAAISSVVVSFSASLLVLRDGLISGLGGESLECHLPALREVCRRNDIEPLILTASLLRYVLLSYYPRLNLELQEFRHIVVGEDVVRQLPAPTPTAIAAELLGLALNVMIAPAGAGSSWSVHAWRALFLLLYLESGFVGSHDHTIAACRDRFPEKCRDIDVLSESPNHSSDHSSGRSSGRSRKVHGLLRQYALEVNDALDHLAERELPVPRMLLAGEDEAAS